MWDQGEVARIVEAIDRDNPCGKRDYAIILLITMLGLRGSMSGGWSSPTSTGVATGRRRGGQDRAPGAAAAAEGSRLVVIDDIRHGWQDGDCPQVFVRHTAPIGPFSDEDHLHQILVKHARVAHVPVSEKRRHDMHSLRHTLATRPMENGTPVEQIADILGHRSVEPASVYLKSSLGLLARCARDPDAPGREVSR